MIKYNLLTASFVYILKVEIIGTECAVVRSKKVSMSLAGKKVALALGVVAGAAIAALAITKSGQKEFKRIGDRTLTMKDDFLDIIGKDVSRIKKMSNRFI